MGRLVGIDYGRKRTGIAATDSLQIVANALGTVPTHAVEQFLSDYFAREQVDAIVVGLPRQMNGEPSESMRYIEPFLARLRKCFPEMPVIMFDERFTSTLAHKAMLDGGMKKSDRRDKSKVDSIAATIILNDYLQSKH
ncbi:MAG: Holliday junction resolvase RuvX [Muribaculaceae bacterium]|nr:Holliday junction resolvase RuvX [Muribaculaceae bacterium]